MTLREYQEKIIPTEHWPMEYGALYPVSGLTGEAGEVSNEVKKMYRDDNGELTSERLNKIKEEMGDVLWYMASLANYLNFNLDDCISISLNKVLNKTWEREGYYHPNAFEHFEIKYKDKNWIIEYYKFANPDEVNNTREYIEGTLIIDKSKDIDNAYLGAVINNKFVSSMPEIESFIDNNYDKFQWWNK